MFRNSISFVTIVVLANFLFVSWALPSYDVNLHNGVPRILTRVDRSSHDQTAVQNEEELAATRFIGDLTVGSRRNGETRYQSTFTVANPSSDVYSGQLSFSVPNREIFHYLSIQNEEGSYMVACEAPDTIGFAVSHVNIRVPPNSVATYTVDAATD